MSKFDRKLPLVYMGFAYVLVKMSKMSELWGSVARGGLIFVTQQKVRPQPPGCNPIVNMFDIFDIFDKNISKTHIK